MLRVGIVGCGIIFPMHAASVNFLPNAQLVGVCDIKKDRADKAAADYGATAYYDYKDMISKDLLDVVHICVPHYMHPVISKYALEQGVHVLCEKPMALTMEDALTNVKIAEENDLKYAIVFQCRYNDSAKLVKETLENGTLGKVISARVVLTWSKPDEYYTTSDWKGTWEKEGGGVVINQAIHSLDLANWFIDDEIVEVQANLSNRAHPIVEIEDTAEGFVRYKNGATLGFWVTNNYGDNDTIEVRLHCENGKVIMNYDHADIFLKDGTVLTADTKKHTGSVHKDGMTYWGYRHTHQIADFYDCIEQDREPFNSGREILKIQKLICDIYTEGKKNFYRHNP